MIIKSFKYRLYPTKEQSILIDKHINSCRFVYNLALETKQVAYAGAKINLSCFELMKQLPDLKKECEWLSEVNAQSLQQAVIHLDSAFTNFFKGICSFPKFKSKRKGGNSFTVSQKFSIKDNNLFIPKFREGIKVVNHRVFDGKPKQVVISKNSTGKYFASVLVETNANVRDKNQVSKENTVGVDLGVKDFLIKSNGSKISNPRFLKKSLSKLKYIQRKLSKSSGRKTRIKFQKLHEKIANQRKDFLHKVSINLIRENQTIAIENLVVKNIIKNHNLAQAILDTSWGTFNSMLEYKAKWYGTNIIRIGAFEPSSKTCSTCGHIKKDLKLSNRDWNCENCQTQHDRDINAAVNIKNFALRNYVSGTDTKNHNELPTMVGVMTCEVHCTVHDPIKRKSDA